MGKKALVLFFAFLLSINSFAAVVADNDGSAFITKAEFDSLKNNFQSQLDQYNTQIDNKIDNAIASYLAGIKAGKTEVKRLCFADWGQVTMLNAALENQWAPPNINLSLGVGSYLTSGWVTLWWCLAKLSYERSSSLKCKRLLVDAGLENNANEYATWIGRSINFVDSIKLSRMGYYNMDLNHICWKGSYGTTATNKFYFVNTTQLQEGYFSDLSSATTTLWTPHFYWDADYDNVKYAVGNSTIISTANAFSIDLLSENNETTDYKHILNWDNYTWPQLTDTSWTRSLRKMSGSTYTCQWMLSNATKDGKWSGGTTSKRSENKRTTATVVYGDMGYLNVSGYSSGDQGVSDTNPFVGVGLVNKTYDSAHIRQSDKIFSENVDNKEVVGEYLNLCNGLPLLAASKDQKVTIELEFDNGYRDGVAEPNMEVDVFLALEYFGTQGYVSDETKRIHCEGEPADWDYRTTVNRKLKLKWTMPADGIVYLKYKPNDTSGNWQVDYNLSKNPTYTIEKDM